MQLQNDCVSISEQFKDKLTKCAQKIKKLKNEQKTERTILARDIRKELNIEKEIMNDNHYMNDLNTWKNVSDEIHHFEFNKNFPITLYMYKK